MKKRGNKQRGRASSAKQQGAHENVHDVWEPKSPIDPTAPWDQPCIGIDLGTTNSCVGLWLPHKNRVKIVRASSGARTIRSMVSFDHSPPLVGLPEQQSAPRSNGVACAKRIIGRQFDSQDVQQLVRRLPFETVANPEDGSAEIKLSGRTVHPVQVAAQILGELKNSATSYARTHDLLDQDTQITSAVIGVPAHFNQRQHRATQRAAREAGFKNVQTLSESTAAAMAYGLFVAGSKCVVVVDLGGGTLDITAMRVEEGKFTVLAVGGSATLGGDDFDFLLAQLVAVERPELLREHQSRQQLVERCCNAKIELTEAQSSNVHLDDLQVEVTREQFEAAIHGLVQQLVDTVRDTVHEAGLELGQVNECVMVGGGSRVPLVRQMVHQLFCENGHTLQLCTSVDAELAVAEGCAVQGAIRSGIDDGVLRGVMMLDALPWGVGLEEADGNFRPLLLKNQRIPCAATQIFTVDSKQESLLIEVYEGEHDLARDNAWVAEFFFRLPPLGEQNDEVDTRQVPVTFEMPEAGALRVSIFKDSEEHEEESIWASTKMLCVYCVLVFALYLVARIHFAMPGTEMMPGALGTRKLNV